MTTTTVKPIETEHLARWRRRFLATRFTMPVWARSRSERLLFPATFDGKWEYHVWDLSTGERRQATDRPAGTEHAAIDPTGEWVWWFDDDRGDEVGRWMRQPFGGGDAVPAAPGLEPAFSAGLVLGAGFAIVGRSLEEGSELYLVRGDAVEPWHRTESQGLVTDLSADDRHALIEHYDGGDARHPALRVVDVSGAVIAELSDGPGRGVWAGEWSPVPGDHRLIAYREREGLLRPAIWSPLTGETVDVEVDLPSDVEASWYPDGAGLLMRHEFRARNELWRYDLARGVAEPVEVERGTIPAARIRPDGEMWYHWNNSVSPPEFRAGDRVLLRQDGDPGVRHEDLDVDGIHGFLTRPAGDPPYPAIFLVHGGPDTLDPDVYSPIVLAWVDHGFATVQVNYRGSTGYGSEWRDAAAGNPGFTELEDLATVRAWLVERGLIDPARVVLSGRSWGGYLTLLGLGTQPDLWSLGIAESPIADYLLAYEDTTEELRDYDVALFGGTPEERPELYRERSPITHAERVRVPVLIQTGRRDPRCPLRQVESYARRLEELGREHTLNVRPEAHSLTVIEDIMEALATEIDFVSRRLGTPPAG